MGNGAITDLRNLIQPTLRNLSPTLARPRIPVISGCYVSAASVTRQRLSNLRHILLVCVCVYTGGKEIQEIHRKEIRIASHKFSSQRQPRFLVLIFKARAAIYYSTTVRICIFSPRILEPPPVWVDSKRGLPKYYLNSRDLPPRLAFYKYFYLAWRREREICVDNGYLW